MRKTLSIRNFMLRRTLIQIPVFAFIIISSLAFGAAQPADAAASPQFVNDARDLQFGGSPIKLNQSPDNPPGGCWSFYNNTIGFYVPSGGKWYLKNDQVGKWENYWGFNFTGPSGSIAVSGDWNGDDIDSVGFYVPSSGKWYLKDNKTNGWNTFWTVKFAGASGAIPVTGDWDYDGFDTPGFYVPSSGKWFLKNDLANGWAGVTEFKFLGPSGSQPVAGDWNGDGVDTVGFYVPSGGKWYLKNNQISGWNSYIVEKWPGVSGAVAITGDWNQDGEDRIGFYVPSGGKWYLKTTFGLPWNNGVITAKFQGPSGAVPVAGDWDGIPCAYGDIVTKSVVVPAGSTAAGTALCPTGSLVTSGGFVNHQSVSVYTHHKVDNGWRVYAKNIHLGSDSLVIVYAHCLHHVPGLTVQIMTQDTSPSSGYYSPRADCPAGTTVTGGGWASPQSLALDVYHSGKAPNGWDAWAYDSGTGTKYLNSYAICLDGVDSTITQESESTLIPASSVGSASKQCASGMLTGGGFNMPKDLVVDENHPDPANYEWDVEAFNPTGSSLAVTGYSECITFP